jgi:hypothetical protein
MSAVCLLSSTRRASVGSAWASFSESGERFSEFCGQVQPGIIGRTFAIRVASAGLNTCSCSSPPPQPPTTIAARTTIAPRVMATVTTRDPRKSRKRVLSPECVEGHSRTLAHASHVRVGAGLRRSPSRRGDARNDDSETGTPSPPPPCRAPSDARPPLRRAERRRRVPAGANRRRRGATATRPIRRARGTPRRRRSGIASAPVANPKNPEFGWQPASQPREARQRLRPNRHR